MRRIGARQAKAHDFQHCLGFGHVRKAPARGSATSRPALEPQSRPTVAGSLPIKADEGARWPMAKQLGGGHSAQRAFSWPAAAATAAHPSHRNRAVVEKRREVSAKALRLRYRVADCSASCLTKPQRTPFAKKQTYGYPGYSRRMRFSTAATTTCHVRSGVTKSTR
ncbi:hypothetical protein PF008_g29365 [Phytophthora fragariae]|uniref:Uncharacterized protein n=2 Tax=Phytophthora fragariae TaxID=53985 RepID=A0A6G0Q8M2_9STRA|nr:hypothetical protein PF008_g29365 [Phytophthora fragariae]